MVAKDRRVEARRRARELQKEESDRLARMQSARTDAFIALEMIDEGVETLGLALDRLLDEGESKKKLAADFSMPTRQINDALDAVGSAHARKTDTGHEADGSQKAAGKDTETVVEGESVVEPEADSDGHPAADDS